MFNALAIFFKMHDVAVFVIFLRGNYTVSPTFVFEEFIYRRIHFLATLLFFKTLIWGNQNQGLGG